MKPEIQIDVVEVRNEVVLLRAKIIDRDCRVLKDGKPNGFAVLKEFDSGHAIQLIAGDSLNLDFDAAILRSWLAAIEEREALAGKGVIEFMHLPPDKQEIAANAMSKEQRQQMADELKTIASGSADISKCLFVDDRSSKPQLLSRTEFPPVTVRNGETLVIDGDKVSVIPNADEPIVAERNR